MGKPYWDPESNSKKKKRNDIYEATGKFFLSKLDAFILFAYLNLFLFHNGT